MITYQWEGEPDNLFRRRADGQWERRAFDGACWFESSFSWDVEVGSGLLVPTVDTHTPADLAMALELAKEIERDWIRIKTVSWQNADANYPLGNWLREEVIKALRGEA